MGALLGVTGLLLIGSAGAKWRAGKRMGTGVQPLTLLELGMGLVTLALAGAGPLAAGAGRLLVPTGMLLLFVSSAVFFGRLRDERRRRALTESRRLEAYVKYLRGAEPDDPDTTPGGSAGGGARPIA